MTKGVSRTSDIRRRRPRPNRVNGDATRARILDAAERLFAEHGYTAVSLRRITAEAGVNVAAIHFHFASKEALFEALFNRRIDPINDGRAAALTKLTADAGKPSLEDVLIAFIKPYIDAGNAFDAGRIILLQFMARAAAEQDPSIQTVLRKKFDPPWHLLVKATRKALPDISEEALNWGLFFLLGSLYFINPSRSWLSVLSNGRCEPGDTQAAFDKLLPFLAAGLRGLATHPPRGKQPRANARPSKRKLPAPVS